MTNSDLPQSMSLHKPTSCTLHLTIILPCLGKASNQLSGLASRSTLGCGTTGWRGNAKSGDRFSWPFASSLTAALSTIAVLNIGIHKFGQRLVTLHGELQGQPASECYCTQRLTKVVMRSEVVQLSRTPPPGHVNHGEKVSALEKCLKHMLMVATTSLCWD
eukprot:360331-Chlamydomonas_euryale.AAC.10